MAKIRRPKTTKDDLWTIMPKYILIMPTVFPGVNTKLSFINLFFFTPPHFIFYFDHNGWLLFTPLLLHFFSFLYFGTFPHKTFTINFHSFVQFFSYVIKPSRGTFGYQVFVQYFVGRCWYNCVCWARWFWTQHSFCFVCTSFFMLSMQAF